MSSVRLDKSRGLHFLPLCYDLSFLLYWASARIQCDRPHGVWQEYLAHEEPWINASSVPSLHSSQGAAGGGAVQGTDGVE